MAWALGPDIILLLTMDIGHRTSHWLNIDGNDIADANHDPPKFSSIQHICTHERPLIKFGVYRMYLNGWIHPPYVTPIRPVALHQNKEIKSLLHHAYEVSSPSTSHLQSCIVMARWRNNYPRLFEGSKLSSTMNWLPWLMWMYSICAKDDQWSTLTKHPQDQGGKHWFFSMPPRTTLRRLHLEKNYASCMRSWLPLALLFDKWVYSEQWCWNKIGEVD